MKHHSIITVPILLKLLAVKIFHKATHHEKIAILGGSPNFHILLQGKCRSPLLRLYSSSSPGKLWFGKGHHTNICLLIQSYLILALSTLSLYLLTTHPSESSYPSSFSSLQPLLPLLLIAQWKPKGVWVAELFLDLGSQFKASTLPCYGVVNWKLWTICVLGDVLGQFRVLWMPVSDSTMFGYKGLVNPIE